MALSLLVGLFLVFRRRPAGTGGAVSAGLEKKRAEAELEAAAKTVEAEREKLREQNRARQEYTQAVHEMQDDLTEQVDRRIEDPDELNGFLKDVGKQVRR